MMVDRLESPRMPVRRTYVLPALQPRASSTTVLHD